MKNIRTILKRLKDTQKGCSAELLTEDEIREAVSDIRKDWKKSSVKDKRRTFNYLYTNTVGSSRKYSKTGTVLYASSNDNKTLKFSIYRDSCSCYQRTGLNKKQNMIKKDGSLGRETWNEII